MPTSSNAEQVARDFKGAAEGLKRAREASILKCADAARRTLLSAPGAPRRVRNMKNAVTTVKVVPHGTDSASAKWFGPAHIVNNPTVAHFISPRAAGRARAVRNKKTGATRYTRRAAQLAFGQGGGTKAGGGRHALRLPDGGFRAFSRTRGTRGKGFFQKGAARAKTEVPKVYRQVVAGELAGHFKG